MGMNYEDTHIKFAGTLGYLNLIALCRESINDNDPYQPLHLRPWFTWGGGRTLSLRKVIADIHIFASYLALFD